MENTNNQFDAVVANVKRTYDYGKFKQIIGNRKIDLRHVKAIELSMQTKQYPVPIIVNEKYEIIDGQHSYTACKNLGLPIYYLMVKGLGMKAVQRLNIDRKNWDLSDYLRAYCEYNDVNYLQIRDIKNKYPKAKLRTLILLYSNSANRTSKTVRERDRNGKKIIESTNNAPTIIFKNGEYKITNKAMGDEILNCIEKLSIIPQLNEIIWLESFVTTLMLLKRIKEFDINVLVEKLTKRPLMLQNYSKVKQLREMLHTIYNYRSKSNIVDLRDVR